MGGDASRLQVFLPLAYRSELPFLILDVNLESVSRKPRATAGGGVCQLIEAILQVGWHAQRNGRGITHRSVTSCTQFNTTAAILVCHQEFGNTAGIRVDRGCSLLTGVIFHAPGRKFSVNLPRVLA